MNARGLLLTTFVSLLAMPAGAGDQLSMKVSPAVAFAPANLVVRAYVTGAADNRAIQVIAESEDFYRSSEIQLDGENGPRTSVFEFRSLPPGAYEVSAVLMGAQGPKGLVRGHVNVMASGAGED